MPIAPPQTHVSKKPQKTRPKKKRRKNLYETQEISKREEARKLHPGTTARARDATHVVVTRYTYGLTRNSVLHQIQCITPRSECGTNFGVSPSSIHFIRSERVLDGTRRILRSNAQSALVARNYVKISKKPQKTRPKKKRGKNLYETQDISKRKKAGKLNPKPRART